MTHEASTEGARCVVLLSGIRNRPQMALLRAAAVAAAQAIELRVVFCFPISSTNSRMLFPQREMGDLRGDSVGDRAREATAWVARLAPNATIEFEHGHLGVVAVGIGRVLDVALFVVDAGDWDHARDAVWVASETRTPVLVARPAGGRTTVLAATNLEDPTLPVVSCACALGRYTRVPVVALHNVPVLVISPMTPFGGARATGPSPSELAETGRRLAGVTRELDRDGDSIVMTEPSTVRAVLDAAAAVDADVVAVGGRPRSWLARLLFGGVAEAVAERSDASVLVAPVAARRGRWSAA